MPTRGGLGEEFAWSPREGSSLINNSIFSNSREIGRGASIVNHYEEVLTLWHVSRPVEAKVFKGAFQFPLYLADPQYSTCQSR